MIHLDLHDPRPMYEQVVDQMEMLAARGVLEADSKLPSVRQMAMELSLNPNTVQKAFESLESKLLLTSVRGSGWYVGENAERAAEMVDELKRLKTRDYVEGMMNLGVNKDEIIVYIKEWNK